MSAPSIAPPAPPATADTLPTTSQVEGCWLQLQSSPTLDNPEVKWSWEDLQADDKQVTCPQPLSEFDFPIFPLAAAGFTPGLPHITLLPSSSSRSRAPLPSTKGGTGSYSKIRTQFRHVLNQIFRKSWQNRARSLHKWNGPGALILSTKTFRHAQHPGRLLLTTI